MRLHQIFRSVAVMVALTAIAPAAADAASSSCQSGEAVVCVATTDTPDRVSASTQRATRYVAYGITITNRQGSTATHVTLRDALPAGTAFVAATASSGTCSHAGGTVTCEFGRLESGAQRTVDLILTVPTSAGTIANTFTASFDERANDGPQADPKQDTVSTTEITTVGATAGLASSYVPSGRAVQISTDPTDANTASSSDRLVGSVSVPAGNALVAALEETPDPGFTCPAGYVCRSGDWLGATVPGTFVDPLRFFLRWDKELIARGQTTKNFAVLHAATLTSAPEIVQRRCGSPTPGYMELPCLWNVLKERDGDYSAVLVTTHNGYMR